jgi:hypothetical protein
MEDLHRCRVASCKMLTHLPRGTSEIEVSRFRDKEGTCQHKLAGKYACYAHVECLTERNLYDQETSKA